MDDSIMYLFTVLLILYIFQFLLLQRIRVSSSVYIGTDYSE